MRKAALAITSFVAIVGLGITGPAEARHYHRHASSHHGRCLRFNKTTGAIAGAVAGGVAGKVILGGTGGVLLGAAAGGVAGHSLAHNRRKHC